MEIGIIHVEPTAAGAPATIPRGHFEYDVDTGKAYKSDGATKTELGSGGSFTTEDAQDAVGAMVDTTLVYTDATPLLSRAALTGDVTASAGSNATTIANDAVTFAKFQNITDARLLGRSAGSSGDMQEISVGSSLDLSSGSLALPYWRNKYDPMRPPSSVGTGGVQDEFIGGVTMSFNGWQNQESSTATAERDGLTLYHPTDSTGIAIYWFTGPDGSSTDWVFHTRLTVGHYGPFNQSGIAILASGTEATPTQYYYISTGIGSSGKTYFVRSATNYTSNTLVGTDVFSGAGDAYLSIGYVTSTKVLTFYTSGDGYFMRPHTSVTLGTHPTTSFGLVNYSANSSFPSYAHFHFIRVRTDADRLNPGS